MSASDKKKLRKELNAAAMTEKQQKETKNQKKQKAYTLTFIIVMVLVVAIVAVSALQTPISNMMTKSSTAVTVGEHNVSADEFNYFYHDAINNFVNQFSSYGDYATLYMQFYGLDATKPLDEQNYDAANSKTWADYFVESATESAKWTYAMYDKAMAEGFTLSEDEQKSLDAVESYLSLYAQYYGFKDANAYVKGMYGSASTLDSYLEYYKMSAIASSYAAKFVEDLEYTDEQYRAHEADKYGEFCSYSYATYTINVSNYLTGGTTSTNEKGESTVTYSDKEWEDARAAALADAEKLANAEVDSVEKLNLQIALLEKATDKDVATEKTAVLYSKLPTSNEDIHEWVTAEDRTAGDLKYFSSTTKAEDGTESISSYTVVLFLERIDNTMSVGTVRHLLVMFENDKGKTYSDGITSFTDEQKAAAKAEAEGYLKQYQAGEQTEEAFTALIKAHSDDTADGLYSNITPDSGYVSAFTKFATAEHKKGDVEIVESEYGYHIMYYVEAAELNYRDTLIRNALVEIDYEAWEAPILEAVTVSEVNTKYVNTDYIISQ